MGYARKPDLYSPTAEEIERSRRSFIWVLPAIVIQQGSVIFRHSEDVTSQIMMTLAWIAVTLVLLSFLMGWNYPWLAADERARLNDEWTNSVRSSANEWGLAAVALIGSALMLLRFWYPLDAAVSIFGLVNGGLVVACFRYAWLNRGEPDEDE